MFSSRRLWRGQDPDPAAYVLTQLRTQFFAALPEYTLEIIRRLFVEIQDERHRQQFRDVFRQHVQNRIMLETQQLAAAPPPIPGEIRTSTSDITSSTNNSGQPTISSGGGVESLSTHGGSHSRSYLDLHPADSGSVPSTHAPVMVAGNRREHERFVGGRRRVENVGMTRSSTRLNLGAFVGEAWAEQGRVAEGHDSSVADIPRLPTSAQLPLLPNQAANGDIDGNDTKPRASETPAGQTAGQASSLRDHHVGIEDASNQDDIDESDTTTPAARNRGNESTNHASSLSDPGVGVEDDRNAKKRPAVGRQSKAKRAKKGEN